VITYINTLSRRARRIDGRNRITLCAGGALTSIVVWLATGPGAAILQSAFAAQTHGINGSSSAGGVDLFTTVNKLLGPALWIVLGLAPLAIAWGAGSMIFNGRHGSTIIGSAIVAVVLVAAAKGIAA
jgi:hypothetical protein